MNELGVMIVVDENTDFEKKFGEAQEIGLESCQLSFWNTALYTDETAEKINAALQKTGFKISLLWAGWSGPCEWNFTAGPDTLGLVPPAYRAMRLGELKAASDFALKIGVSDIATHVGFLPENMSDSNYAGVVACLKDLCVFLKTRGQNFLFESGQETPVTLLRTIEAISLDNTFINFDTANVILYGKANPVDAVRVFGKYIRNTHIKDGLYPTDGSHLGRETKVGDGLADFSAIFKLLRSLGYRGPFTIEREITGEEQKRDIADTATYLRKLLKEV